MKFRNDIQGLRCLAVIVVIIFHFGNLPNGYLGVDVFFVISGFIITSIIYKNYLVNNFSIIDFYKRRIKRILPLVMIINIVVLIGGALYFLPDDLENLAQSVIATNFFSNNILLMITIRDYWNPINEFKPLMHTWSLGIEEQFYVFYPLLFLFIKNKKVLFNTILTITLISLCFFVIADDESLNFYFLLPRFFELSIGGLVAIKYQSIKHKNYLAYLGAFILSLCIFFEHDLINPKLTLILTVLSTTLILLNLQQKLVH